MLLIFTLFLSFDRSGAPSLNCFTTVVWPVMMETFDVMFSGKVCIRESEIDGDRTNESVESFARL